MHGHAASGAWAETFARGRAGLGGSGDIGETAAFARRPHALAPEPIRSVRCLLGARTDCIVLHSGARS